MNAALGAYLIIGLTLLAVVDIALTLRRARRTLARIVRTIDDELGRERLRGLDTQGRPW